MNVFLVQVETRIIGVVLGRGYKTHVLKLPRFL